ncbi:MAG: vitamin K epoxide reductase family protein [Candidatus Poseidonia sp.]|nr:vitamin K epoxide reductase family protein [Poseidonia sp.]
MNQNLFIVAYAVPLLFGLILMTRAGDSMAETLSKRNPLMVHARRRHMLGLNLVGLVGFVVSVHTLWISNKISEGGNVCSSATVFSCDDVLGNAAYNTDPVFGLSWGLIGMVAFGSLLFITQAVGKEPDALWAEKYLKYGMYMTGAGLGVIALLVSYEIEMGKICQFCTMAHISNVIALFGFWRATQLHDKGEWKDNATEKKAEGA